jgi:UDP-N-acetyl-D-mannosaminuronic acid dehydrogenase
MQFNELTKRPNSATVIGLGYVGLPTAVLLAQGGIQTIGVDINEELLISLETGAYSPKEPGLVDLLKAAKTSGMLRFSDTIQSTDSYIIAVPTPINEDKSPGMQYVLSAAEAIAKVVQPGQLVVLESTSPPGATKSVARRIGEIRRDLDVSGEGPEAVKFAYCPERVLPGNAIHEIVHNERLIGGVSLESAQIAETLYKCFTRGNTVVCTDSEAELAKLVENSYRDINIAFANEVARIASKLGVQSDKVISLANRHPRVNILSPGVGVGGHCISVDPWFLVHAAPDESQLIEKARIVNDDQPQKLALEVARLADSLGSQRVIVLGLSYKPDSDDLRESPAIAFCLALKQFAPDLNILAVEPNLKLDQLEDFKYSGLLVRLEIPDFSGEDLVIEAVSHSTFAKLELDSIPYIRIPGTGQIKIEDGA